MVSRTPCGYYQGTLGHPGLDLDFVVRGQSRSTSSRVRQRHCLQDPQETRRLHQNLPAALWSPEGQSYAAPQRRPRSTSACAPVSNMSA